MVILGGLRSVWLLVLFDLPADTPKERKNYCRFRTNLLKDGFSMMQYSVYMRHCASIENCTVHEKRIQKCLPPLGEVRTLVLTDKQFGRMKIFYGKKRKKTEKASLQLEIF